MLFLDHEASIRNRQRMKSVKLNIRSLFSPAITLMARLSYTRKLPLLGSMALVSIVLVVSGLRRPPSLSST
jgi:hypothetical protein